MLSDTPRQKLAAMIALDGVKVAFDAKLCEALLRDYCGEFRLEIAALTAAVKWGIPKSLQQPGLVPPATLRANLARRLQENHGLAEESAYWAVDAWTSVLQQLNDPAVPETASNLLDEHDSKLESHSGFEANVTKSMPATPVKQAPVQSPYQPPSPTLPPLPKPPSEPQAAPAPKPAYPHQSPPLPQLPQKQSQPLSAPPPKPAYHPPSPSLPPLPKPPSVPPPAPPPRPAPQPYSPTLPPLPPNVSVPPPPRSNAPAYQPPRMPMMPGTAYQPPTAISQPPQAPQLLAASQAFESGALSPQLVQVRSYLKLEVIRRNALGLMGELQNAGVQPITAKRMVKEAMRGHAWKQIGIAFAAFIVCLILTSMSVSMRLGFDEISYILSGFALMYLVYRGIRLIEAL
ncbi:MAG TPA: hypothetical protein VKU19_23710 [Bryobacteraceae bacterium]|nr:hypothetical protein [Bryobacteraceae bacterium]